MVKDLQTVFIDSGADAALVKSLTGEDLQKSGGHKDKSKLVPVQIQAHGKHGTYTTTVYKSPEEAKAMKQHKGQQPEKDKKSKKDKSKKPQTLYFRKSDCGNSGATTVSQADVDADLMKHYASIKGKKPAYHEWKKSGDAKSYLWSNYFISKQIDIDTGNGKKKVWTSTEGAYKNPDGTYTAERQKLHDEIVKKIVDSATSPKEGEKPVAILMGGGSASGKGTCRSKVVIPEYTAAGMAPGIADSDDIKSEMPEYSVFKEQDEESAAFRVHNESSDIANEAFDALIANNKNLLFDGTMKNYAKYTGMIDKLHDAGYDVVIVGVDIPLEEAYKRSDARAEHTGRKVPHGIIEGSHGGFALTMPQLIDKVDSSILYDNSNGLVPIMQDGEVLDQGKYDTFLKKGETHVTNKRIKGLSKQYDVPEKTIRDYVDHGATLNELEEFLETMGKDGLEEFEV